MTAPTTNTPTPSNTSADEPSSLEVELRFSSLMDCQSLEDAISVNSTTESGKQATIDTSSIDCLTIDAQYEAYYYGPSPSIWRAQITLNNVYDGIHVINVNNVTNADKNMSTNSIDHFMFRIGQSDNPIVFPFTANYSSSLLFKGEATKRDTAEYSGLYINHKAADC